VGDHLHRYRIRGGACLRLRVEDIDNPAATWRFALETSSTGTRLAMWAQMGPGPSGVTYIIAQSPEREEEIVARRLDMWLDNMRATVAGIKNLAEGG
jgi:hypothetical protein